MGGGGSAITENSILYHISANITDICKYELSMPMLWWSHSILEQVIGGGIVKTVLFCSALICSVLFCYVLLCSNLPFLGRPQFCFVSNMSNDTEL